MLKTKKFTFLFALGVLLLCTTGQLAFGTFYTTVQNGNWSDPATWTTITGALPPCSANLSGPPTYVSSFFPQPATGPNWFTSGSGDTILVRHTITMTHDLFVRDSDVFIVDTCGVLTAGGGAGNSRFFNLSAGQFNFVYGVNNTAGIYIAGQLNVSFLRNSSTISVEPTGLLAIDSSMGGSGDLDNFGDFFSAGSIEIDGGNLNHYGGDLWVYSGAVIDIYGNGTTGGNFNNRAVIRNLFPNSCITVGGSFFNLMGGLIIGSNATVTAGLDVNNSSNPIGSWSGVWWCAGRNGINIPAGLENCQSPCNFQSSCVTFSIDNVVACDSFTWINGVTYTTSNTTATDTLVNAASCDSIVTLNLTINNSSSGTDSITACESYTWINGITYIASNNTATDTLVNAAGCDSIVTLNLTIDNSSIQQETQELVQLYGSANGLNWAVDTNWLDTTLALDRWHGIQLTSDRCHVEELNLSANNLAGTIPNLQLPELKRLRLQTNAITTITPFDSLNLDLLSIEENRLNFDHLEQLVGRNFSSFTYAPQDSIATTQTGNTLTVEAGGTYANHTFQWYRDNLPLAGQTDSFMVATQAGAYRCEVTNAIATGLTLYSRVVRLGQGYSAGEVTVPCTQTTFELCLSTADSVSNGLWGLGYCLEYDTNAVRPTGNYTLGPVVTTPGGYATLLDTTTRGRVFAGIYLGSTQINYLSGSGTVICIEFEVLSTQADSHSFPVCDLTESYDPLVSPVTFATPAVTPGSLIVTADDSLKLEIIYWDDSTRKVGNIWNNPYLSGFPMNDGNLGCFPTGPRMTADSLGRMFGGNLASNTNALFFSRNIPDTNAVIMVINSADATRVFEIWAGIYANPNIYELIAADADGDGRIRIGDMSAINARSVLTRGEFIGVRDWHFVSDSLLVTPPYQTADKDNVPTPPECLPLHIDSTNGCITIPEITYQGILTGDVDGSWTMANRIDMKTETDDRFEIRLDEYAALPGNLYRIPVYAIAPHPVKGWDLDIQFDPTAMRMNRVVPTPEMSAAALFWNWNAHQQKRLFLTAGALTGWQGNDPIGYVEMESFHLPTPADFGEVSGYMDGKQVAVSFTASVGRGNDPVVSLPELLLFPNPAAHQLNLQLANQPATPLHGEIIDPLGKVVMPFSLSDQMNHLDVSVLAAGMYWVRVPGYAVQRLQVH